MIDYHAIQLTGSRCGGRNCACASAGDAIYFGTGGRVALSADGVRSESGASCTPGVHSASGGIFISDVQRVCANNGVTINYGTSPVSFYRRWTPTEAKNLLSRSFGAIFLGDYDGLPAIHRAPGSTFRGDHSAWGHDYRTSLSAHGGTKPVASICWHDPLRKAPIRLPWSALLGYWQKPTSAIRGFAGFVERGSPPAPPTDTTGDDMEAFPAAAPNSVADCAKGTRLYQDSALKHIGETLGAARTLPYIGNARKGVVILVHGPTAWYVREADAKNRRVEDPCA